MEEGRGKRSQGKGTYISRLCHVLCRTDGVNMEGATDVCEGGGEEDVEETGDMTANIMGINVIHENVECGYNGLSGREDEKKVWRGNGWLENESEENVGLQERECEQCSLAEGGQERKKKGWEHTHANEVASE